MRSKRGIVYLVGAGPGDPKLITVKGREVLERADTVIYDHLVSERLLEHCPSHAARLYVGKQKGKQIKSQEAMNRLLIRVARSGKTVVRLKGGDPFLFGRGGEEALALAKARVPYEVVPGVTSAIAVPAYAGIPVTHRNLASSVAFVTGHEDPSKPHTSIPWDKLAAATDTLVCLMGVSTLAHTATQLIRHGRPAATPCAVIEWGTLPAQRTVIGTLRTIAKRCERSRVKPPAIVVVGAVVTLHRWLSWFDRTPLFGKRIVVTRPSDRAEHLAELLEALGADVRKLPAIELAPIKPNGVFHRTLQEVDQFDWVFFTSPEGIHWFQRLLAARRKDLRILQGRRIGAIGPKTAASIRERGIRVDFLPTTFSQEGMLDGLHGKSLAGKRALILSAQDSRDALEQGLRTLGMEVRRLAIYRTVMPTALTRQVPAMFREPIDYVTVTSSSCVDHLVRALRACGLRNRLRHLAFASIGPVTSATVRQHGGRVAVEATTSTIEGLVERLVASVPPRGSPGGGARQHGGKNRGIPRLSAAQTAAG